MNTLCIHVFITQQCWWGVITKTQFLPLSILQITWGVEVNADEILKKEGETI